MSEEASARTCRACGRPVHRWSRCKKCGEVFCLKHSSPRAHACPSAKPGPRLARGRSRVVAASVVVVAGVLFTLFVLQGRQPGSEAAAWIYSSKLRAASCPHVGGCARAYGQHLTACRGRVTA